ncbi:MAG: RidA family protein [Armatimonadetes bacterium]|nr:RidA family protein [Armatimonadota bacterium]
MRRIINPSSLPPPRGFNHGILTSGGDILFLAGQDASDAAGRIVAPGDLVGQIEQLVRNLRAVVEAAGGSLRDIVKLNIFVRDREPYVTNLGPIGERYRAHFGDHYPAMALFEVTGLFREAALIEMEGIAVIGAPSRKPARPRVSRRAAGKREVLPRRPARKAPAMRRTLRRRPR